MAIYANDLSVLERSSCLSEGERIVLLCQLA
jgi:hypothetical protein